MVTPFFGEMVHLKIIGKEDACFATEISLLMPETQKNIILGHCTDIRRLQQACESLKDELITAGAGILISRASIF